MVDKGKQWNGAGYGQWSLGRLIYELSGECVLSVDFDEYATTKPRDIRQLASECSQIMAGVYYVVTLAT